MGVCPGQCSVTPLLEATPALGAPGRPCPPPHRWGWGFPHAQAKLRCLVEDDKEKNLGLYATFASHKRADPV